MRFGQGGGGTSRYVFGMTLCHNREHLHAEGAEKQQLPEGQREVTKKERHTQNCLIFGCDPWNEKSTDDNSRLKKRDANQILQNALRGQQQQSARYIAHLLPNFPGIRVV